MRKKFVFISGGVISGIGKGVTASSIALLLQECGFKVAPIKFEGYLNIDAGTINPIEHGDPFLCEDGTEADMDIGSYEKFLNRNMTKENFVTMGQIYQAIIDKERRFEYNGEDVEATHICEEIINRIQKVAQNQKAEIIIIELGGTAGEYWNVFFYEASRILALKNPGDVMHVHVSYVPVPQHLGEPKTKPTQLSVRTLNSMGIQPDFIVARSEKYLDIRRRDRFAVFCNMHGDDIISNPDVENICEVPIILHEQKLEAKILKKLGLKPSSADLTKWKKLVEKIGKKKHRLTIGITGKYFGTGDYQLRDSYAALFDALDHASWYLSVDLKTKWIDAEKVEKNGIENYAKNIDGMIVPIGWGERGAEGMIEAAGYARDKKLPYLGLCYGMQLAIVSFARDVLGWKDANTSENDPKTKYPVIHLMPSQKQIMKRRAYGGTMRLGSWNAIVKRGTLAWEAYQKYKGFINQNTGLTSERHRHRYEFNSSFEKDFENKDLVIAARSTVENLVEIIELPKNVHPFYLGTQGHPEYKSRPLKPHPIFLEFIEACIKNSK